jgi:hypothetical protein
MGPDAVTIDSLPRILRDAGQRQTLLCSLREEQGRHLPLSNRVAQVASHCNATPAELDVIADLLLAEDEEDDVLSELVFHPAMSDETLFRILDAGRSLSALGHRSGPEELLLRLASEHQYPEAILTLALHHYGPESAGEEKFLGFVRQHLDLGWLREAIRKSPAASQLSGTKREHALRLIRDYEAERNKPLQP